MNHFSTDVKSPVEVEGSQLIQANGSHLNLSSDLHLRLLLWSSTGKAEIRGQIYGDFRKRPFSLLQCGNAEASHQLTAVKWCKLHDKTLRHDTTHTWTDAFIHPGFRFGGRINRSTVKIQRVSAASLKNPLITHGLRLQGGQVGAC